MSNMDKLAKKMLMEKEFAPLERDLPKGGRQMKIAEPLGAAALPEAGAGLASRLAVRAAVPVGMLIPSSTGEEQPLPVDVDATLPSQMKRNKSAQSGLPKEYGGNSPTKLKPSKDEKFIKRFEQEGKKHFGEDFMYEVDDRTSNPPEKYNLKLHSDEPTDELQRLKGVGMHSVMRKNPKMGSPKGGKMNIPKSPNRVVELEEDED